MLADFHCNEEVGGCGKVIEQIVDKDTETIDCPVCGNTAHKLPPLISNRNYTWQRQCRGIRSY